MDYADFGRKLRELVKVPVHGDTHRGVADMIKYYPAKYLFHSFFSFYPF